MSFDFWIMLSILVVITIAAFRFTRPVVGEWRITTTFRKVKSVDGRMISGTVMQRLKPNGEMEYREETDTEMADRW